MKHFLFLLFIFIIFIGCKDDNYKKILIIEEPSWTKEIMKDSSNFRIIKNNKEIIYEYRDVLNDSFYRCLIRKEIRNDSYLNIYNKKCSLIDTLSFMFNGQKVKIYKYLYDDLNGVDEETDYYFNPELGLVFAKDLSWGINIYFDSENLKQLHDSILKNEVKFKPSFKFKYNEEN